MGKLYTYRLSPTSKDCSTYEIGVINSDNPEYWCDYRICEGFWGNENMVKYVVRLLNEDWSKKDVTI